MQPFKRRGDQEQSANRQDPRRTDERSDEQGTSENRQASDEQETAKQQTKTESTEGEEINTNHTGTGRVPEWNPSIDVFTKGKDLLIRAALPGVNREEVKITLSGGILTFSGAAHSEDPSEGYRVREIQRGPFRRSVSLPADRDSDKIKATLQNGVLEITVQGGAAVTNEVQIEV